MITKQLGITSSTFPFSHPPCLSPDSLLVHMCVCAGKPLIKLTVHSVQMCAFNVCSHGINKYSSAKLDLSRLNIIRRTSSKTLHSYSYEKVLMTVDLIVLQFKLIATYRSVCA